MDREESNISHKIEDGILHVTVDGSVTVTDIVGYAQNNIEVWASNPRVLWDFRLARFPYITRKTLDNMSDRFGEVFEVKADSHTAILVRDKDDLMGDYFVNLSKAYSSPVEYKAFVSPHEAQKWLQSF